MPMASDFQTFGHQIITKLQRNLQNGQWVFKSTALWQIMEIFIEPLE